MKKNKSINNSIKASGASNHSHLYAGNFSSLPVSTAEPKGKILSWNWEPMQETYAITKKTKGVA